MNVIFEKDGEVLQYGVGSALYLLLGFIPMVGALIVLIMTIMKRQFRGVWLNQLIVGLILGILFIIGIVISAVLSSAGLVYILYIAILACSLAMTITYTINANLYSVKQRLEEGYTVKNLNDPQVAEFVEKARNTKLPFFQITRF